MLSFSCNNYFSIPVIISHAYCYWALCFMGTSILCDSLGPGHVQSSDTATWHHYLQNLCSRATQSSYPPQPNSYFRRHFLVNGLCGLQGVSQAVGVLLMSYLVETCIPFLHLEFSELVFQGVEGALCVVFLAHSFWLSSIKKNAILTLGR